MAHQNTSRHTWRLFGLVTVLSFLGVTLTAQQEDELQFIANRVSAVVGQPIRLTLQVPEADPARWETGNIPFPEGLSVVSGPNVRAASWADPDGRVRTGTQVTWSLTSRRPGFYTIPAFSLFQGGRRYRVAETVSSFVGPEEAGLRFPLNLNWVAPARVWVGQPFFLALQVRNLEFVPEPDSADLTLRQDAVISRLREGGDLRQYQIGPFQLLELSWAAWSVIPLRPGNLVVPPSTFTIAGVRKQSPEIVIPVMAVPFENPTGAVGNFTRAAQLESGPGEFELVVVQTVQGLGNLPVLKIPPPGTQGLTLINETEEQNFLPTPLGYEGSITKRFYLQKVEGENPFLVVPPFSFFDPIDQKLRTLPEIRLDPGIMKQDAPQERREDAWPEVEKIRSTIKLGLLEQPLAYLALAPGLVLFLVILFGTRVKRSTISPILGSLVMLGMAAFEADFDDRYQEAARLYQQDRTEECLDLLDKLMTEYPQYPLLGYPRALALSKLQRQAEALVEILRLEAAGIQHEGIEVLRAKLTATSPLMPSAKVLPIVNGDILYFVIVLCVNAGLIFLAFGLKKGSVFHLSASVTMALILIGGLGMYAMSGALSGERLAVIGPEAAALRRIPESSAEVWVALDKGTQVNIFGRANDHLRIKTADGMEGWVLRDEVLEVYRSR